MGILKRKNKSAEALSQPGWIWTGTNWEPVGGMTSGWTQSQVGVRRSGPLDATLQARHVDLTLSASGTKAAFWSAAVS